MGMGVFVEGITFTCSDLLSSDTCPPGIPFYSDFECNIEDGIYVCIQNCCGGNVGCFGPSIGNGWCDERNNIPECAYDGGDCCESTCINARYPCGVLAEYNCQDLSVGAPISTPCILSGIDGSECAGGIDAFNPHVPGNTLEMCCECGPGIECTGGGCDPNWTCVRSTR